MNDKQIVHPLVRLVRCTRRAERPFVEKFLSLLNQETCVGPWSLLAQHTGRFKAGGAQRRTESADHADRDDACGGSRGDPQIAGFNIIQQ